MISTPEILEKVGEDLIAQFNNKFTASKIASNITGFHTFQISDYLQMLYFLFVLDRKFTTVL